jgi:thioredoxin reductase
LGSGDIGLIMARRLSLEGCEVRAVLEIMPYSNGLTRNVVQCLEDYGIPLYLSHTIVAVHGQDRVTGVTCAKVDDRLRPVPGSEFDLECDCLLLSVGLIPENELSGDLGLAMDRLTGGPVVDQLRQTSLPGFFAAGNVVHVHDLVDFVSEEGETAGRYAAHYSFGLAGTAGRLARVAATDGVRTAVPQIVRLDNVHTAPVRLYMRVGKPERKVVLQLVSNGKLLLERKLPVAKPGEMVVADIPADKLREVGEVITAALRRQGGEQGE